MKRESFKSRLGFILVSAGCAIGIGNVWRFPYVVGENGGGLFVILYLVFLIAMGLPVLTMELAVGRASRKSAVLGYKALEKPGSKWHLHGWAAIFGCYMQFLDGAAEEDKLSLNKNMLENPEMLDALIGVYERNVLGYPATAVLPYSQALSRFPAHLQQLDMESNGKSVNRFGEPVNYVTGPVIFGEPGTNGQHSFYQLLHQGTDIVPLQFIGFKNSQIGTDVVIQDSTSQQKLCANVAAQIVAFACGKADDDRNKNFEGGRPSSIIIGEELNPETLGALLAHFENKVMFQGFLWNINSFDQEGVQLGKVLAKRVLAHETDGALKVYSDLLNI